jgi:hypothetical protein
METNCFGLKHITVVPENFEEMEEKETEVETS